MRQDVITGIDATTNEPYKVGVLTSGGDAQGMNAAVRAVVRTLIKAGASGYAIKEGWAGALAGGEMIQEMDWSSVSSILGEGGTRIGTARSREFREYAGRHQAAANLLAQGIDRLVVIGGDGSLTGANQFREEWPQHVQELQQEGAISAETAAAHPNLTVVGLVGSIDNDLVGTDMTIGADTALARIITAIDEIASTAASHQRTFIIEVMGRHCGYLPLMAAVAGGADYVFTPEDPAGPTWPQDLCKKVELGRQAGRRESLIVIAEGAVDQQGTPVSSSAVKQVLADVLNEDARISVLGHTQRGGSPSAYDRWMSTLLGYAAAQEVVDPDAQGRSCILGVKNNRVTRIPLEKGVADTKAVKNLVETGDYQGARRARGVSYYQMGDLFQILSDPPENRATPEKSKRVAIIHAGGLAPGMNAAARAAVRIGLHHGWTMLGVDSSWQGLSEDRVRELNWEDVEGWGFHGGAELGTRRAIPGISEYYAIGRAIERNQIDALMVVGGMNAYLAVRGFFQERDRYPAFHIPMVLVPASIDNNLPGTELSIGVDTAVNNNVWALDRIRESAAASRRCFVVEAMGRKCGYLTLMSAISAGAEFVYLNEEPLSLARLSRDAKTMRESFASGRRLSLVVVNEEMSTHYQRSFVAKAFEAEGEGLFDVRDLALGYIQQGGAPTCFDRLLATRFAKKATDFLADAFASGSDDVVYVGTGEDADRVTPIQRIDEELDLAVRRPKDQWWLTLLPVARAVSLENDGSEPVRVPIRDAAA